MTLLIFGVCCSGSPSKFRDAVSHVVPATYAEAPSATTIC